MNTGQLIVLWYSGLLVSGILVSQALGWRGSPNYGIAAIVVLTAILLYTLKEHPQARKGLVLFWVTVPLFVILLSALGLFLYIK